MFTATEVLLMIAAIGVVGVNMITAWRNGTKIDQTLMKTAVIEGHVNSEKAQLVEQLKSKETEITLLKNVIVDKDKDKALLAQAAIRPRGTDIFPDPKVDNVQKEIAKNTKDTADTLSEIKDK